MRSLAVQGDVAGWSRLRSLLRKRPPGYHDESVACRACGRSVPAYGGVRRGLYLAFCDDRCEADHQADSI